MTPCSDSAAVTRRLVVAVIMSLVVLGSMGCGKPKPPPIVEAGGTINVDGKPLPAVRIRFIPMFPGFGAEVIAEGVSDEQGRFSLTCNGTPGACVGTHRVLVEEGPLPPGAMGESGDAQMKMTRYLQGLANRPIPPIYGNLAQSPLEVEIKADEKTYDLKLSR